MTDSRVALGLDRLPWLPDEPVRSARPPRRRSGSLIGWAFAAILSVAALSYWLGMQSRPEATSPPVGTSGQPSATLVLPEAKRVEPGQVVEPVQAPDVRPVPAPEIRPIVEAPVSANRPAARRLPRAVPPAVAARVKRTVVTEEIDRVAKAQAQAAPKRPVVAAPNTQAVKLWPARQSAGASGRVVQIGAFGTRLQAKRGWWHMVRAYPAVKRLPAVVVEARNSRGRPFYRFQIGTTSQAHSEVLCQRMEKIRFSCAVVGLPGAKKAVER
jgi:hypothetical protein